MNMTNGMLDVMSARMRPYSKFKCWNCDREQFPDSDHKLGHVLCSQCRADLKRGRESRESEESSKAFWKPVIEGIKKTRIRRGVSWGWT